MIKKWWLVSVVLLYFSDALANGYVTVSPVKEFKFSLNNQNIQNAAGVTSGPHSWDLGANYIGTVTCPVQSISAQAHYYKAQISNIQGISWDGFVAINDYLEIKVEIYIAGNVNNYVTAPFDNVSNQYANPGHACVKGGSFQAGYGSGGQGRITFRVRKPIINGVQISERQLVEIFGRFGNTVRTFGPTPMARIIIESALLFVPEKCVINGGTTVQVEFGDLPQRGLDGTQFATTVPLTLRCQGGIFDNSVPLKINLAISGKGASFSQTDLRTTRDDYQGSKLSSDLAIRFKQLDGQPLLLNTFYPVTLQGDSGSWGFIAAPLQATGSEVAPGDFYATATIVAEFQ